VRLTIDTLEHDDNTIVQLLSCLQYGINGAAEAELVHPEFISDLRTWIKLERTRLRPEYVRKPERDTLRESKHWAFWNSLQPGQEVRWKETKTATYFVVTGDLLTEMPEGQRGNLPVIELRRHSGKTFYTHISKVLPYDGSQ